MQTGSKSLEEYIVVNLGQHAFAGGFDVENLREQFEIQKGTVLIVVLETFEDRKQEQ